MGPGRHYINAVINVLNKPYAQPIYGIMKCQTSHKDDHKDVYNVEHICGWFVSNIKLNMWYDPVPVLTIRWLLGWCCPEVCKCHVVGTDQAPGSIMHGFQFVKGGEADQSWALGSPTCMCHDRTHIGSDPIAWLNQCVPRPCLRCV